MKQAVFDKKKEIAAENKKIKADYIFCLPGHPSSGIQASMGEMVRSQLMLHEKKQVALQCAYGSDVYSVRNNCLCVHESFRIDQKPFQGKYDYDRMIWVDSDNLITLANVQKLISRDVDIVGAWYRMYSGEGIAKANRVACGTYELSPRTETQKGMCKFKPYTVNEMEEFAKEDKLIDVGYSGFGLMVIKAGVFESIDFPWFEAWCLEWENDEGQICRRNINEDLSFCVKAQQAGYKVYVDPTVQVYHEKRVLL
jgi:hypothetical protein